MPSQPPVGNLVGKGLGTTNNNNNCPPSDPYDEWASGRQATLPNRNQHNAFASGFDTAVASTNWPTTEERDPAAASPWQEASSPTLTTQPAETTSYPINKSNLLDRAKSILAIVGLLAVCVQIVRIVT
jgi:hypothetical protein